MGAFALRFVRVCRKNFVVMIPGGAAHNTKGLNISDKPFKRKKDVNSIPIRFFELLEVEVERLNLKLKGKQCESAEGLKRKETPLIKSSFTKTLTLHENAEEDSQMTQFFLRIQISAMGVDKGKILRSSFLSNGLQWF